MKEQIGQLITKLNAELKEVNEVMDGYPELSITNYNYLLGKFAALNKALDGLRCLSMTENGSQVTQTATNGTYNDGYDAGLEACLKEMR